MLPRQEALGRGYSDDEIRRLYTRGEWQRIGRGAYLSASVYSALGDEERHRFLIDSTLHALSDDAVLSHQSAAVVYGLPLWRTALDRVHVTRNRRGGGRIKRRITEHCAPVGEQVAVVDEHSLTLPARTVVDLARTLPFEQAVVTGEFDGRVKYGRLLKPGQSPGDAVFAEKQREDALRDLGFQVVRWTWDDLESPAQVVDRIRRAIARAESPRGWVAQAPLPSVRPLTVRAL